MAVWAGFVVPHPPILLPEIGRGEETKLQATMEAYREVMRAAAALQPDTIVVISPHAPMYADYIHISDGQGAAGDMGTFRAPELRFAVHYDAEFVAALASRCACSGLAAGTAGADEPALDHGTMVPLYFLREQLPDCPIVRIGLSGLSVLEHYELGQHIAAVAEKLDRRVVCIASGDLSHKLREDGPYGFAPEGPVFDARVTELLGKGDFLGLLRVAPKLANAAAECGLRSIWIMSGTLDCRQVSARLLSYEGPFGVGYGVACFLAGERDERRDFGAQFAAGALMEAPVSPVSEDAYVRLARFSLETYVNTGREATLPSDLPAELLERLAGCFVSLKKDGQLRGCIGTMAPVQRSLAEEIMNNAISAAVYDPRFPAVQPEELPSLVYSVDVLSELEPVASLAELDVQRYGVVVRAGRRRGLLLPALEGVTTPEQQVAIAREKAGIAPEAAVSLYRFEVIRHL